MITFPLTVHHLAGDERLPAIPGHYGIDPPVVRTLHVPSTPRLQDVPRERVQDVTYGSVAKCGHSRHGSYLQCSEPDCPKHWSKHQGSVEDFF